MSSSTEEGNDHICPDCGVKWWDSDGGCCCTKCRHCGKVGDEDFAQNGYCDGCHVNEIDRLNDALDKSERTSEARRCANIILCDDIDALKNRIRALEFQNAELRAKT